MPRRASNDNNDNDDKHEAGAGFSTPEGGGCMRNVLGQRGANLTYGEALKGTLVGSKRGAGGNTSLEGPKGMSVFSIFLSGQWFNKKC